MNLGFHNCSSLRVYEGAQMAIGTSNEGFRWVCGINGGLMLQAYVPVDGIAIVQEGEEKSFRKDEREETLH